MPSPIDLKAAGIRFGPKMTSKISRTMATSRGPMFGRKASGEVTMGLVYGPRPSWLRAILVKPASGV